MRLLGLVFVGTRTDARSATAAFARDVLGLAPADASGMDAEVFSLPDGSSFAVTSPDGPERERTVGFLVDDVRAAAEELGAAGIEVDEVQWSASQGYVHFRAPDGHLYELVENLPGEAVREHEDT